MQIFYLIPTRQNVGLTSVALGVACALQRHGFRVGFVKPVGEVDTTHDHSLEFAREICLIEAPNSVSIIQADERLAAGQDLRRLGAELAQTMLAARRSITAIFCVNDIMAAGAGDYLRQSGAAARVQVAGYDHIIPALSQEGNFSTVAVDFEAMGEKALDLMARPRPDDQKITRVMPRLIIRNNDGRGPDEGGISGA